MRLYNIQTPLIAITGGVASGKSTLSELFRKEGELVLSADQIIHNIYEKPETFQWFHDSLPKYLVKGKIDRKTLSNDAFKDPEILKQLESFLYPRMEEEFQKRLPASMPAFFFYEIPLLFEKSKQSLFDEIILVLCPVGLQKERLMTRSKLTTEQANNIIQSQMPWSEKKEKSDYVLENSGTENDLKKQAKQLLKTLKEKYQ